MNKEGDDLEDNTLLNIVLWFLIVFVLIKAFNAEYKDMNCDKYGTCGNPSTHKLLTPNDADTPIDTLTKLYRVCRIEDYMVKWRRNIMLSAAAAAFVWLGVIRKVPKAYQFIITTILIFIPFYWGANFYHYHQYMKVMEDSYKNYVRLKEHINA